MTEEEIIQCVKDSLNRQKLFIDLECVKFLEKENKQLKAQIEKMIRIRKQRGCNTDLKQSLDLANERETEWANRIEGLKTDLEYAKAIIKDLLDNSHEYARQNAEDFIKGEKK